MKRTVIFLLIAILAFSVLSSCGTSIPADSSSSVPADTDVSESEEEAEDLINNVITEEQALAAIKDYCYRMNPDLEEIEQAGEYPVYWEVESGDEEEIVILFRSYTGAEVRYYIDPDTGDTYVTEFVSGITPEEERTDENFNIRDY